MQIAPKPGITLSAPSPPPPRAVPTPRPPAPARCGRRSTMSTRPRAAARVVPATHRRSAPPLLRYRSPSAATYRSRCRGYPPTRPGCGRSRHHCAAGPWRLYREPRSTAKDPHRRSAHSPLCVGHPLPGVCIADTPDHKKTPAGAEGAAASEMLCRVRAHHRRVTTRRTHCRELKDLGPYLATTADFCLLAHCVSQGY